MPVVAAFFGLPSLDILGEWIELEGVSDELGSLNSSLKNDINDSPLDTLDAAKIALEEPEDPLGLCTPTYRIMLATLATDVTKYAASGAIRITSSHFVPADFLRTVHGEDTWVELHKGFQTLSNTQAAAHGNTGDQLMRQLVREHFERFVKALQAIQSMHGELKAKGLASSEFGLKRLADNLNLCALRMKECFGDFLRKADNVMAIRRQVAFCERFEELFALPGILDVCMKDGNLAEATKAYRIALSLMNSLHPALKPRIYQGLWLKIVNLQIEKLKAELLKRLSDEDAFLTFHLDFLRLLDQLDFDGEAEYLKCLRTNFFKKLIDGVQGKWLNFEPAQLLPDSIYLEAIKSGEPLQNSAWSLRLELFEIIRDAQTILNSLLKQAVDAKVCSKHACDQLTAEANQLVKETLQQLMEFKDTSDNLLVSVYQASQLNTFTHKDAVEKHLMSAFNTQLKIYDGKTLINLVIPWIKKLTGLQPQIPAEKYSEIDPLDAILYAQSNNLPIEEHLNNLIDAHAKYMCAPVVLGKSDIQRLVFELVSFIGYIEEVIKGREITKSLAKGIAKLMSELLKDHLSAQQIALFNNIFPSYEIQSSTSSSIDKAQMEKSLQSCAMLSAILKPYLS